MTRPGRSLAAKACSFFAVVCFSRCSRGLRRLKHQKNQKCFHQRGFFAAWAFALQTGQNHGAGKICPLLRSSFPRFSKHSLCPSAAQPSMFFPLSPEAYLLALKKLNSKIAGICFIPVQTFHTRSSSRILTVNITAFKRVKTIAVT